jgi:hypothetical protein
MTMTRPSRFVVAVMGVTAVVSVAGAEEGPAAVERYSRQAWTALKGWSCGDMVTFLARHEPVTRLLGGIWKPAAICASEVRSGFICESPDAVLDGSGLLEASVRAAWANREACFKAGDERSLTGMGAGLFCGFTRAVREQLDRVAACFGQMQRDPALRVVMQEILGAGCDAVGQFASEALLGVISGTATVPAVLGKWIGKMKLLLRPESWQRIETALGASSEAAASFGAEHYAGRQAACGQPPAAAVSLLR